MVNMDYYIIGFKACKPKTFFLFVDFTGKGGYNKDDYFNIDKKCNKLIICILCGFS